MQGNVPDQANQLKTHYRTSTEIEVEIGDISSVLAVHAGEGTLAVLWYE